MTIPNSVTSIGKYAFYKCTGLKTFIVEDGENPIAFEYNALYQAPIEHLYIGRNWSDASEGAISTGIKSVEIGNSVTELPDCAFYRCTGLTSVTIPNSVISIGVNAFYGCSGLTSVTIPNSVTSIGEEAFSGCSGLTSVIIPNSVTSIYGNTFNGCSGLEKSAYPSGLSDPFGKGTTIQYPREGAIVEDGFIYGPEKNAIYFAPLSLEGEYVIPNSVMSIGDLAFSGCSGLTSVTIPNSVMSIGDYTFCDCSGLTSVTIPNSITSIGNSTFKNCSGLTSVTIPNSVTSIGEKAFSGCSGLTSVIIPNSVTSIYGNTFNRCSGLRKSAYPSGLSDPFSNGTAIQYPREGAIVEDGFIYGPEKNAIYFAPLSLEGEYVIPNSVMSIGDLAFSGCSGLTSVKTTTINPPVMNDNSFEGLYDTAALSVPEDAVTDYLATNWSLFENLRIGDSETAAQTYETGNLKYMLIPGKTQEDKNLAVVIPGDYSSLTQVTIPERFTVSDNGTNTRYFVDGIGFKAFNGCSGLATVTFNSRNASKAIGDYAFAGTKISELTIPATVESIGTHAFDGCKSLTGIVIPGSVGTIGDYAFNGCTALTNANLETGVEAIGNHAFDGCKSLTGIVIPGSVRTIGDYAFNECIALTNANLEAGVKSIGDYAFYNTPLKEITLNEGLETIGEYCFSASGDRAIEPVYIPSSLTSVGADAFMNFNCRYVNISDLTAWCNIDFGNENSNPAAHRQGLYLNGEKIEDLVIPESVNAIKDYAFCFNSTLKSVEFNDALQSIGKNAFKGCNGLTAAVIPGDVTVIGDNAFASTNVHDLTFAYGAKPIEVASNAFNIPTSLSWDRPIESLNLGISSLESLTIGNSVTEIPAAKFKGIASLTSLTLGNSLTTIGDEAFSGCTALTEVILPPSVETVGASAFAGNNKLASIIMGHKVTTIGEKAYDLCPAQTVSITAQTPPTAPDNTFSNYTGSLYVQGQTAADAYYDADYCWYQFEGHVMIEPTEIRTEGDKTLSGKPGDTFQLTATLWPENVTLPQVFWRSTNPDIATVDANGLVTLHADMSGVMAMAEGDGDTDSRSCKIIAESLYADGPVAEFTVNDTSIPTGIDDVVNDSTPSGDIDFSAPVEVYNLQGVRVADSMQNLANGIYIVRQGDNVKKIAVR